MRDLDTDQLLETVLGKVRAAASCNESALQELKTLLEGIDEANSNDEDLLDWCEEAEEEFNLILNDAEWRSAHVGPKATQCPELLILIFDYVVKYNENLEVVLASNPFIPEDLSQKLANSDFRWEEDGTTQTLARNTPREAVLRLLAESQDNSTRYAVAANEFTPPDVLALLARDVDISDSQWLTTGGNHMSFIQAAVVRNPQTGSDILHAFAAQQMNFSLEDFEQRHGYQLLVEQDLVNLREFLVQEAEQRVLGTDQG